MNDSPQRCVIVALYCFTKFTNYRTFREPLLKRMLSHDVLGTLLLAKEGINGTIAGSRGGIDRIIAWIKQDDLFKDLNLRNLDKLPESIENTFKLENEIQLMAKEFLDAKGSMFLGRGNSFPIALEGALKLKELSYLCLLYTSPSPRDS